MILTTSLIGGWHKLELWDHTHIALFGLLSMICVLEVILLKMTTSAGLFNRPHHHDADYDDSSEYEEDIYYEDLHSNYDQWARRQMRYRQRQLQQEQEINQQYQFNPNDNHDNSGPTTSPAATDIFRYVLY